MENTPIPAEAKLKPANADAEDTDADDASSDGAAKIPFNLQKRDYELDAVRYGDWELNGKCVDF